MPSPGFDQDAELAPIVGATFDEVVRPHVPRILGLPDTLEPLAVHMPAGIAQQGRHTPIAEAASIYDVTPITMLALHLCRKTDELRGMTIGTQERQGMNELHADDRSDSHGPSASGLRRPGWPEILVGLVTWFVMTAALGLWMLQIPDAQAGLRGNVGLAIGGIAGSVALALAALLRIRNLRAFGFRSVAGKWIVIGLGLGVVVNFLNLGVAHGWYALFGEGGEQHDFQSAATSGVGVLLVTLVTGAILTPFGEEVLFRGVIANALDRYRAWISVIGSAVIFGLAHGVSIILPLAIVVGLFNGVLFRKTGSIWPGLALHTVYNGLNLLRIAFFV